jgi:7,8-dihydropterin-6-yl-methyl-4-(beta-D-ribofuranosyl)aminobenzene 5'-phosphate synthase
MRIQILFDNYPYDDNYAPSWGFSCIVKGLEKTILFDTGNSEDILTANMEAAGVETNEIDIVFISHAHWDHAGGLSALKGIKPGTPVYIVASAEKSLGPSIEELGMKPVIVSEPQEIMQGVFSTGEMESAVINEHSLVIETDRGGVLITGCAHPGIVNIVEKAIELTGKDLFLVLGGFHLSDVPIDAVKATVEKMFECVRYVAPGHCTGDGARDIFRRTFGDRFIESGVGKIIDLETLEM